jgi:hypothetical protein
LQPRKKRIQFFRIQEIETYSKRFFYCKVTFKHFETDFYTIAISHLKECDVSVQDIVKIDGRIDPVDAFVESFLRVADRSVGNDFVRKLLSGVRVDALVELPHERVHADDGEDQPEDQTDELKYFFLYISETEISISQILHLHPTFSNNFQNRKNTLNFCIFNILIRTNVATL